MMKEFLPPIVPGKSRKQLAKEVLDYCFKVMPDKATRFDVYTPQFIPLLKETGNNKMADEIADVMHRRAVEDLEYEVKNSRNMYSFDIQTNVYILQQLSSAYRSSADKARAAKYNADFERFIPYAQSGQEGAEYEEE